MQKFNSKKEMNYSSTNQYPLSHQHFFLTQKGFNQAYRNNSCSIWDVLGGNQHINMPITHRSTTGTIQYDKNKKKQNQSGQNNKFGDKNQDLQSSIEKCKKKNVTFNVENSIQKNDSKKGNSLQKNNYSQNNRSNPNQSTENGKVNINNYLKNKLTPQQEQKRQIFLKQCYSIDKYLKSSKAYTRLMPNSTVKLFYQKPCIQAYGRKNTKGTSGFIYNDFMKTHNVLPHRMSNEPKKYQTYRSALNFCKRTKIDLQERWKKIHRQMRKKLDMKELVQYYAEGLIDVNVDNLQSVLKLNINQMSVKKIKRSKSFDSSLRVPATSLNMELPQKISGKLDLSSTRATNDTKQPSERIQSLKRSKSWGKKEHLFLYKYTDKEGNTQYCKDRHGITCYVDPTFQENKQAFIKFQKRIHPIQAEDVDPSDRNIDQILLNNFVQSKQEDVGKHYLLPNCQQPYRAQKYSWKGRKKSMMATASTQKQ